MPPKRNVIGGNVARRRDREGPEPPPRTGFNILNYTDDDEDPDEEEARRVHPPGFRQEEFRQAQARERQLREQVRQQQQGPVVVDEEEEEEEMDEAYLAAAAVAPIRRVPTQQELIEQDAYARPQPQAVAVAPVRRVPTQQELIEQDAYARPRQPPQQQPRQRGPDYFEVLARVAPRVRHQPEFDSDSDSPLPVRPHPQQQPIARPEPRVVVQQPQQIVEYDDDEPDAAPPPRGQFVVRNDNNVRRVQYPPPIIRRQNVNYQVRWPFPPRDPRAQQYPKGKWFNEATGRKSNAVAWMFVLFLDPSLNYPPINNLQYRPPPVPPAPSLDNHCTFMTYQLEYGDQGNPNLGPRFHLQGLFEFSDRMTAANICHEMGWTADNGWDYADIWLEPVNGPRQAALDYVTKEHTRVADEHLKTFLHAQLPGQLPPDFEPELVKYSQGALRPLPVAQAAVQVRTMVKEGMSFDEIADVYPQYCMQYHQAIRKMCDDRIKATSFEMRKVAVYILWGDTGCGKSYDAWHKFCDGDKSRVYAKPPGQSKFMEGYDPSRHKIFVMEEYKGELDIDYFKRIIDGHPVIVEVKGSSQPALWDTVIITSNMPPHQWYPNLSRRDREAFMRRLSKGGIIKYVDERKLHYHLEEIQNALHKEEHVNVKMVDGALYEDMPKLDIASLCTPKEDIDAKIMQKGLRDHLRVAGHSQHVSWL